MVSIVSLAMNTVNWVGLLSGKYEIKKWGRHHFFFHIEHCGCHPVNSVYVIDDAIVQMN